MSRQRSTPPSRECAAPLVAGRVIRTRQAGRERTARYARFVAVVLVAGVVTGSAVAAAQSLPPVSSAPAGPWIRETGVEAGWHTSSGVIGRGRNGPGGEPIVASADAGPTIGARTGVFGRVGGVEVAVAVGSARLNVMNDAGTKFPNHAERPVLFTGLGKVLLARGRARPFVAAGVSGALLAADLDNANGPTWRLLPGWSLGAGMTWTLGQHEGAYLMVEVRRQQFKGVRPFSDVRTTAVTVGVGHRY